MPPDLSVTEWAVLAVLAEAPTHGFAVARELARDGDLGRIWTVPRPLVYRALGLLEEQGLLEPVGSEPSAQGPTRRRVRATRRGKRAVDRWLHSPVTHVRDFRTQLLLKFRLLDRRGADLRALAEAQRAELAPVLAALEERVDATRGFDRLLHLWRSETAQAAVRFLDHLEV